MNYKPRITDQYGNEIGKIADNGRDIIVDRDAIKDLHGANNNNTSQNNSESSGGGPLTPFDKFILYGVVALFVLICLYIFGKLMYNFIMNVFNLW